MGIKDHCFLNAPAIIMRGRIRPMPGVNGRHELQSHAGG